MNEATQKMADYSLYQTILVAIGTAVLLYTLRLTANANKAASAAAEAANATNEIMRSEHRPWLKITKVRPQYRVTNDDVTVLLEIEVENVGRDPATDVAVDVCTTVLSSGSSASATVRLDRLIEYAQSCAVEAESRRTGQIIFDAADNLVGSAKPTAAPRESSFGVQVLYCVTYRGASTKRIYYTTKWIGFGIAAEGARKEDGFVRLNGSTLSNATTAAI